MGLAADNSEVDGLPTPGTLEHRFDDDNDDNNDDDDNDNDDDKDNDDTDYDNNDGLLNDEIALMIIIK